MGIAIQFGFTFIFLACTLFSLTTADEGAEFVDGRSEHKRDEAVSSETFQDTLHDNRKRQGSMQQGPQNPVYADADESPFTIDFQRIRHKKPLTPSPNTGVDGGSMTYNEKDNFDFLPTQLTHQLTESSKQWIQQLIESLKQRNNDRISASNQQKPDVNTIFTSKKFPPQIIKQVQTESPASVEDTTSRMYGGWKKMPRDSLEVYREALNRQKSKSQKNQNKRPGHKKITKKVTVKVYLPFSPAAISKMFCPERLREKEDEGNKWRTNAEFIGGDNRKQVGYNNDQRIPTREDEVSNYLKLLNEKKRRWQQVHRELSCGGCRQQADGSLSKCCLSQNVQGDIQNTQREQDDLPVRKLPSGNPGKLIILFKKPVNLSKLKDKSAEAATGLNNKQNEIDVDGKYRKAVAELRPHCAGGAEILNGTRNFLQQFSKANGIKGTLYVLKLCALEMQDALGLCFQKMWHDTKSAFGRSKRQSTIMDVQKLAEEYSESFKRDVAEPVAEFFTDFSSKIYSAVQKRSAEDNLWEDSMEET